MPAQNISIQSGIVEIKLQLHSSDGFFLNTLSTSLIKTWNKRRENRIELKYTAKQNLPATVLGSEHTIITKPTNHLKWTTSAEYDHGNRRALWIGELQNPSQCVEMNLDDGMFFSIRVFAVDTTCPKENSSF